MSIAKCLPDVVPFFMQDCPLCGRSNRMVVQGQYIHNGKTQLYPDIGYSFCNCKAIFYTRKENVTDPINYDPDQNGIITLPDPFFAWPNPYDFQYWNPRKYEILWDMYALCENLDEQGINVVSVERDFDVNSKTPQHFHIKVKHE